MMITESSLAPPNPRMGPLGNGGAESSQTDQQEFRTLMNRPESQEESQAGRQRRLAPQKERAETASPLRETHSKVSPERKKETDSAETDHSSKTARVKKGAIRKFMDSLESELGISAERLSAALAQLPAEMKDRPIDETAPLIMQQLGFVDSSDNRAMVDQYLKLADVNGLLGQEKPSVALPERPQLGETLMSDSQGALDISQMKLVDREKLNLRIDDLNRRFFDTQLSATSGAGAQKLAAPLASGMEGIAPQEGLQPSVKTERSVEWNP